MGNMLSFMDIFNKSEIASNNGDYLTVSFQLGRFARKVLDFKTMTRASYSLQSINEEEEESYIH